MNALTTSLLALAGLAAPALAQTVGTTIGPSPAPLGSPISITVSIDYQGAGSSIGCPYRVLDGNLNEIYDPSIGSTCDGTQILIGPWGWVTNRWEQIDQAGQQVPPGHYYVEVSYDVGPKQLFRITVGGAEAGVVLEGTATIGKTLSGESRHFWLTAPQHAGQPYVLLVSSSSSTGISTCGGTFPLDLDPLFIYSLTSPDAVVQNAIGVLDGQGSSEQPVFALPSNPNLVGVSVSAAFAVLNTDPLQPCFIRAVSNAHDMTIIG